MKSLSDLLEREVIETSAPCRIDMGGTLDISTFHLPLRHLAPCTFNMAIALRTRVRLLPHPGPAVKVSSRGFESAEFPVAEAPFDHPLGLIFALAAYFNAAGVHIEIDSASPPRSALGGSSAAVVALAAAFSLADEKLGKRPLTLREIALLAQGVEGSVLGVPCGIQDQLAAVYGGVNAWHWPGEVPVPAFRKEVVVKKRAYPALERHLLLAYGGVPHASTDVNGQWVRQYLAGRHRDQWREIARLTRSFVEALPDALSGGDFAPLCAAMNQETGIRCQMTPDVLDAAGRELVAAAMEEECGARFTGAGGGGCIWAIGPARAIDRLRPRWEGILAQRPGAAMLDCRLDSQGLLYHSRPA